ncbi:DUF6265 family protein [Nevskia sp.]|uniref:DUF6265 family protein n=1 Tax=Nevskia sp. TaxID=1929292 RepID=UPI0025E747E4|nr:DUF6265 family protein [Nevskia sp.]
MPAKALREARSCGLACLLIVSPAQAADIHDLRWLAGCWSAIGGDPGSGEQWTLPAANTMFGVSRTVRNGTLREFEYSRIAPLEDGRLAFHAQPSGQPPTVFPVLRLSADEVVFEALDHDFPQRVIYRQTPEGLLAARIEGLVDGRLKGIDFPLQRARCEASP